MNKYIYQGFWCFARSRSHEIQVNPRNPAKFTKTRKILWNSVEILSNTCLYSNFETCLSYWGYLLAVSSQIYEQRSETTRRRLCCEKLGTSHDVKGFAIGSFLEVLLLKEQMMSSVRKTLKTLIWSAQNWSISCEICPENNHKICRLFTDCFPAKFTLKIPAKSTDFSAILSPKIQRNLTFFSANYQKPWYT